MVEHTRSGVTRIYVAPNRDPETAPRIDYSIPLRVPHHEAALHRDVPVTDAVHDMARTLVIVGYHLPADVHRDLLNRWEAVLAERKGLS